MTSRSRIIRIPDSPGKRKIFSHFEEFLRKYLTNFFQKKVLCLLGLTAFELDNYRNLKVLPQNIWSVEREKDICRDQVSQKKLKGINVFQGNLKDFTANYLYRDGKELLFDIMNIDLCGNFLTYILEISQLMPSFLSGNGLAMAITTLHQHDQNLPYRGQLALNLLRSALNGKPLVWRLMHNLENEESYINRLSKSSTNERYNLYREVIFLWWLAEQLIIHQIDPEEMKTKLDSDLKSRLAASIAQIEDKFSDGFSRNSINFVQDFSLYRILKDLKSWFWPIEIMRFNYIGTGSSRFSVWFIKLEKANRLEGCRSIVEIIEEMLLNVSATPLYLYEADGNKITIES